MTRPGVAPDERRAAVGYITGTFDLFDAGHLALLCYAKANCDYLIVGVATDEMAIRATSRPPVIPFIERMLIVQSLRIVDAVVPQASSGGREAWNSISFDVLFVGEDLRETGEGQKLHDEVAAIGARIQYTTAYIDITDQQPQCSHAGD